MFDFKEFANNAAKWGLILGVVMSISRIFEIKMLVSGSIEDFIYLTFEWIGAVVVYIYIVYIANRQRARVCDPRRGYSLRDTLNYTLLVSIFAAVIVAISSHIYINNSVGGYAAFAEASNNSILAIMAETETNSESTLALLEQSTAVAEEVAQNPPTILSAVVSSIANYIIAGFFATLAIFLFVRRKPDFTIIKEDAAE